MPAPGAQLPAGVSSVLTSGLAFACRYAAARPDCQRLAAVRYGQIALCARCDQRRSTTGKGIPPVRLPDPHVLLEVAAAAPPASRPRRHYTTQSPGPARQATRGAPSR